MKRNHDYFILKENSLSARFPRKENIVSKISFFVFLLLVNKEITEYPRQNRMVIGYLYTHKKRCNILFFVLTSTISAIEKVIYNYVSQKNISVIKWK